MKYASTDPKEKINWLSSMPFFGFHALAVTALLIGVDRASLLLCGVLYFARMFFITAGYHRYFSHRSFKTGRTMQFLIALGGTTAVQKGPLWWAAHHRKHHLYADTDRDIHSPQRGFWWSHVGWILCDKYKTVDYKDIRDLARYPELRFLDRQHWLGPAVLLIVCALLGGYRGVLFGFFLSTVLLWHATFAVNSIAHLFGRRRYETSDTSRNSLLVALMTNGEGWHNNHHHYPTSARQGFFWWEIDLSYYLLYGLSTIRLVHDVRTPPQRVLLGHAPKVPDEHRPPAEWPDSTDRSESSRANHACTSKGRRPAGAAGTLSDTTLAASSPGQRIMRTANESLSAPEPPPARSQGHGDL